MVYLLKLKPGIEKDLEKLPKKEHQKILLALSVIASDPFVGKKLEGEYAGNYSYRVWPYRIIYQILKKQLIVLVIRIGHRQGVYKK